MLKITATVVGICDFLNFEILPYRVVNVRLAHPAGHTYSKGKMKILAEEPIDDKKLKEAIGKSGYIVTGIHTEPYEKKGLLLFHR